MFKNIIALAAIISLPLFAVALAVYILSSDSAVQKVCATIGAWSLIAFVISFAYIMIASAGSGPGPSYWNGFYNDGDEDGDEDGDSDD